jgi:Tfp pilus assembly pilus retraction ATPase PilT
MSAQDHKIELLLEEVIKKKASDLHLQVGLPPMLRIDGALVAVTGATALSEEALEALVFAILDDEQKQILLKDKEFDFSFAFGDLGRFRVNAFHERGNLAAALRLIPPHQQPQIRAQLSNILMAICSQRLVPAIGGGRIAAAELLVATPAVRNIIREGKSHQLDAVIQTGGEYGMQSMDKTLVSLVHAGTITYDEARMVAIDLDELDRLMRG